MWKIRHVLAERQTAWENSVHDFKKDFKKLMNDFEAGYLEADDSQDAEMEARLERFQHAFFGIEGDVDPEAITQNTVRGVKAVAKLKLTRFESVLDEAVASAFGAPLDITESYMLFIAPHTPEGIQGTVASLLQTREESPKSPVAPHLEKEVLRDFVKELQSQE